MRGFFGGLLIGLVTVVIAVVALALLAPTQRPAVSDGAPQAVSEADAGAESGGVTGATDADLAETAPTPPGTQTGQSDTLATLEGDDTPLAVKPEVVGVTVGLSDPGAVPQASGIEGTPDAPPAALPRTGAPTSPQDDTQPTALANPDQPVVPDVSQSGSGLGSGPAGGETVPQIAVAVDTAPDAGEAGLVTTAPAAETAPVPSTATPSQPAVTAPSQAAPVPQVNPAAPSEPAQPEATPEPDQPQIAALPQTDAVSDDQGPSIGTRVVPLTERGQSTGPLTDGDPATQAAAEADVAPADGPWIEKNAVAFDNPDNRPMMAIVLIDDSDGFGAEALAEFPYPLSFAVDPADSDAAAKMARHRAAGFEVVALTNLPVAANAQDAEVSLSVWLDQLPQVVALLEGTGTGVQGNRELSDQVTAIADSTGLGLIMQSKGLNTAQKLAARAGVPSALVFRDFDGAGQTPQVMRRFLDQAAFRAGQQGGVIMLGRLRPETISALILWGLQDRASRLALAPVSAVLTRAVSGQ